MGLMESKTDVRAVLKHATDLVQSGLWDDAIHLLTESNQQEENAKIETRLVKLRHLAFDEIDRPATAHPWPKPVRDHFPDVSTIPEIPASELSVELVASAIQYHGSIIVRGMFDTEASERIRQSIDETFAGAAAVAGKPVFDPSPWYTHFVQRRDKGYEFGGLERHFVTLGAGVLAVDSPRALFRYLDSLAVAGIDKFLYEYFGERPVLSAKKSTLRRTPPDAPAGWHQDGAYYSAPVRALNIWAAFSRCGVEAPSIDIFPRRFDDLVETGGPGIPDEAISDETAARCGIEAVERPVFEPGDALLFDEMALHRTGVDKTMTETRYAIEMWFFAASMFPHQQVPLYL